MRTYGLAIVPDTADNAAVQGSDPGIPGSVADWCDGNLYVIDV